MFLKNIRNGFLEKIRTGLENELCPPRCICLMFCQSSFSGLIGILVQAQAPILWGFLDAWTKFLSTVRDWIGSIVGTLIFKVNISPNMHFGLPPTCIEKMGVEHRRSPWLGMGPHFGKMEPRAPGRFLEASWAYIENKKTKIYYLREFV